jgi:hypothetical protein
VAGDVGCMSTRNSSCRMVPNIKSPSDHVGPPGASLQKSGDFARQSDAQGMCKCIRLNKKVGYFSEACSGNPTLP